MIKFTLGEKGNYLKKPTYRTLLEHDNNDKENKTMRPIDRSSHLQSQRITQGKRFFFFFFGWKYKE